MSEFLKAKESMEKYKQQHEKLQKRRETWNLITRDTIKNSLQNITSTLKLEWSVDTATKNKNFQAVSVSVGTIPFGIMIDNSIVTMSGASLLYSQLFNGKILVLVFFPTLSDLVEKKQPTDLGTFEPEDINEELIESHFAKFFDFLTLWEDDPTKIN